MPVMDGLELQQRLKSNGRNLPIIFITAYVREGDRERAFSEGAIGFLTKPFSEEKLVDLIKVALEADTPPRAQ